jgi:hypothetical protein
LRTVAGRAGRVARDVTHGLRLLGCAAVTRGGDVETTARPGPQRSSEALRCGTGPCCGGGSPRYPQRAPGSRCGSPSIERDREARRPGGPTWQRLVGATSSGPVHRPHPIREVRRGPHTVPSWRAAVNGEPHRRGTGMPPCRRIDGRGAPTHRRSPRRQGGSAGLVQRDACGVAGGDEGSSPGHRPSDRCHLPAASRSFVAEYLADAQAGGVPRG